MPVRHSGKDMQNAVGASSVDFRGDDQGKENRKIKEKVI